MNPNQRAHSAAEKASTHESKQVNALEGHNVSLVVDGRPVSCIHTIATETLKNGVPYIHVAFTTSKQAVENPDVSATMQAAWGPFQPNSSAMVTFPGARRSGAVLIKSLVLNDDDPFKSTFLVRALTPIFDPRTSHEKPLHVQGSEFEIGIEALSPMPEGLS